MLKSARCCGAKHVWKSNASKTEGFEPLLMCQMSFCSQIDGHRKKLVKLVRLVSQLVSESVC